MTIINLTATQRRALYQRYQPIMAALESVAMANGNSYHARLTQLMREYGLPYLTRANFARMEDGLFPPYGYVLTSDRGVILETDIKPEEFTLPAISEPPEINTPVVDANKLVTLHSSSCDYQSSTCSGCGCCTNCDTCTCDNGEWECDACAGECCDNCSDGYCCDCQGHNQRRCCSCCQECGSEDPDEGGPGVCPCPRECGWCTACEHTCGGDP